MIKFILQAFYTTIIVLLSASNSFAGVASGKVLDSEGTPLVGAACIAFTLPDSAYFAGTTTDADGAFSLECPDQGKWFVRVSLIGFESRDIAQTDFHQSGTLTLRMAESAEMLGEVVVKAKKPQLVERAGSLCYNNLSDIINTRVVSSAHDLLKNLPLISSQDGNALQLAGAPLGSVVYLNGRPSQMSQSQLIDYLKAVPAEQIKEVEIIYNPPPKWKTRSAVINVVIKNANARTLNGMGRLGATLKHRLSEDASVSAFAGLQKTSVNLVYSLADRRSISKSTTYGRHDVRGTVYEVEDTTIGKSSGLSHSVYAQVSHQINDRNSVEASYLGAFSPADKSRSDAINSHFGQFASDNSSRSSLNAAAITFSNASGIDAGIEYSNFSSRNRQHIWNDNSASPTEALTGQSRQEVNSFKVYGDAATKLPRAWSLMYGASFNFTRNTNSLVNKSNSEDMEGADTKTKLDERKGTAYVGAYRYFLNNRFFVRASIQGELYKIGNYSTHQLMPRIALMYRPGTAHIVQASYSEFRVFPSYWERQEYMSYSNPYSISMGNPSLKPMHYQVATVNYIFKGTYTASLNYYRTKNFYLSQVYQSPDALVQITQPTNIDFSEMWMLSLNVPLSIKDWLYTTFKVDGVYDRYKANDWHNLHFDKSSWTAYITADNTVVLSKSPRVTMNVTGMYIGHRIVGLWERSHMWMLNAGLSAAFLNGRLVVDFKANDLLETVYAKNRMRIGTQYLNMDNNYYARNFSLTLSYKFKGYKESHQRTPDTSRLGIK